MAEQSSFPSGPVRDHFALRVSAAAGADRVALAEGLKAAVQGVCRLRVDEVMFDLYEDEALIRDERRWD